MKLSKIEKVKLVPMISNNENISYDYQSGFSRFTDGSKFKYNDQGDICLSTGCSTWAKRLLHDVPLSMYIQAEEEVQPLSDFLTFPEFGTLKRKRQWKKESVGNYIEDCEYCGEYMEKTFRFYGKLVCFQCRESLKKQNCDRCDDFNSHVNTFIEDCEKSDVPFNTRFIKNIKMEISSDIYFYCNSCKENLSRGYTSYLNDTSSWDEFLEVTYN